MERFFYWGLTDSETYRNAVYGSDLDKIDLYGTDYLFAECKRLYDDLVYRVYTTDTQTALLDAIVQMSGGKSEITRYYELIRPQQKKPEMTPEEIIRHVAEQAGMAFSTGGDTADGCTAAQSSP